ncbi:MAG: sulfatase family protein, partial [Thermomicrobiales bacterium]
EEGDTSMFDRRALLAAAAGAFGAAAVEDAAAGSHRGKRGGKGKNGSGGANRRPNFVVVVLDDMRASDWQALPETRRRLSAGTWFNNYFMNSPLCSPSRVSLLTGQNIQNHQVQDNGGHSEDGGYDAFRRQRLETRTINYALNRAGYRTGMIGKFLNGFKEGDWRPAGWDRWAASTGLDYTNFTLDIDGEAVEYTGAAYKTDVLRDLAVQFVENVAEAEPLFLYFTPTAPHGPAEPARRHAHAFANARVARDYAFNEADMADKPTPIQALPLLTAADEAAIDEDERNRLRTLLAADEAIVAILDAMRRAGRMDDTYVFVMSDNGYMLGEHRLMQSKGFPYGPSIRVPMLAWGAGFKLSRQERLAANVDIAPTIAALAKVPFPGADGADLLSAPNRDFIPIAVSGNQQSTPGTGLRSKELMYFEYVSGEREFYDLRSDPRELVNLLPPGSSFTVESPAGLPAIGELSARSRALARCAGTGCL